MKGETYPGGSISSLVKRRSLEWGKACVASPPLPHPSPTIQRRKRYGGIELIDRIQRILGAVAIDRVEGIVEVELVDRIGWVVWIEPVDWIKWIRRVVGVDGIQRVSGLILVDGIEDVEVPLVLLVEPLLRPDWSTRRQQ